MSTTLFLGALALSLAHNVDTAIDKCPLGGELRGSRPPGGTQQWCEAENLFGRATKSGPFRQWHDNGRLEWEGAFLDGKPHGTWTKYDPTGLVIAVNSYRFGRRVGGSGSASAAPSQVRSTPQRRSPAFEAPDADASPTPVAAVERDPEDEVEVSHSVQSALESMDSTDARAQNAYVYSGLGPGEGKLVIGVGGRLLVVVPMLDLHFVYGFSERFDFESHINSVGLVSLADLGVRYRLVGDASFSLAARVGLNAIHLFALVGSGISFGPMPGLTVAFGSRDLQVSLSADVPIHVVTSITVAGATATRTGAFPFGRGTLALETMVGKETSLYVAAQLYIASAGEEAVAGALPFLSIGASW